MRAVIQRASEATVSVEGSVVGSIGKGLVILLGVGKEDSEKDADYVALKIANLRIFEDDNDKMNLSVQDIGGEILLVSQFTLYGDVRKGRRPGFDRAGDPAEANRLYEYLGEVFRQMGLSVQNGVFGAHMAVSLVNDGPVTILLDSEKVF